MIRWTAAHRRDAVERLLKAARAVAARASDLTPSLMRVTGLTAPVVDLGFQRHLELHPTPTEMDALLAATAASVAPVVTVILSANVFVAPLRALALAWASAPKVVVRPSRRDPILAEALVAACGDASLTLAPGLDLGAISEGEVHAYGRDETLRTVRASLPPSVRLRGHGTGMGLAILGPEATPAHVAALADDVVPFDQRGCLSPRLVVAMGPVARAEALAEELHRALGERNLRWPRGLLEAGEQTEARRYLDAAAFAGVTFAGDGHAVGCAPAPLLMPPSGRHVHVVPAANLDEARALVAPLARYLVTVGGDDVDVTRQLAPPHARVAPLGALQRPPFDGPVDRR